MDITSFIFSEEVSHGLRLRHKPIIALESTIITHGMPYPQNLETARDVEQIIRDNGCIPCTIAVMEGFIHIGLTDTQMNQLAKLGPQCEKLAKRDISRAVAFKLNGSTTVSATISIADAVGIKIFVTGGIGGVHRQVEKTWDISSDIQEIGAHPLCVVCSGAKSILDIPKTLQLLETNSVQVIGWRTKNFPSFFTSQSDVELNFSLEEIEQVGAFLHTHFHTLKMRHGVVVAVPINTSLSSLSALSSSSPSPPSSSSSPSPPPPPLPSGSIDPENHRLIERAIQQAIQEADSQKISGKDLTPFLLKKITQLTEGKSLEANIFLIKNNANVASKIAISLLQQQHTMLMKFPHHGSPTGRVPSNFYFGSNQSTSTLPSSPLSPLSPLPLKPSKKSVCIIGSLAWDLIARPYDRSQLSASNTSYPGYVLRTPGGVGFTLARCIKRLLSPVSPLPSSPLPITDDIIFISTVGDDVAGQDLILQVARDGININYIKKVSSNRTASYNALLDGTGSLVGAISDMRVVEEIKLENPLLLSKNQVSYLLLDCNPLPNVINDIVLLAASNGIPIWVDTVSTPKCIRVIDCLNHIDLIKPNGDELLSLVRHVKSTERTRNMELGEESSEEYKEKIVYLLEVLLNSTGLKFVLVSLGSYGCILGVNKTVNFCVDGNWDGETMVVNLPLLKSLSNVPFRMQIQRERREERRGEERGEGREEREHQIISFHLLDELSSIDVIDVTGSGDTLFAATSWAYFFQQNSMLESIILGMSCARLTVCSEYAISEKITHDFIQKITSQIQAHTRKTQPPPKL